MKIKKRLKYKSTLPKADFGMDASNMNMQKASMLGADSDEGGGMGAIQGLGMGLNTASGLFNSLMPEQNMNNISKGGQIGGKVAKTAFGALSQSSEPASKAIGMVGSFLTDPIMQLVAMVRENHKNPLHDQKFEPVHKDVSYSFGEREHTTPIGRYKFGGFLKHYGNGGEIKYDSNFRPDTEVEQKYNEKTGLWEVGGAKPKPVTTTKTPQKIEPIYVTDPNDKRLKAYNDSLSLYNMSQYDINNNDFINDWKKREDIKNKTGKDDVNITLKSFIKAFDNSSNKFLLSQKSQIKPIKQIFDDDVNINKGKIEPFLKDVYKKPVQPVIYKKPEVSVPVPKFNVTIPQEEKQSMQELLGKVQYASEPTSQHEKPVESGTFNNMFTQEVKTINGKKIYKRKDTKSPWIEQYKNGGEPTMKEYQDFNNFRKTVNPDYLSPDYDLQSAFRELPIKVLEDWKRDPEKNHLPDTYKLPNHPTFSTESKYYKPGMPAGYWKGNAYIPIDRPVSNITKNPKLMGMDDPNKQKDRVNKELERNNGVRPGFALGGDPRAQANIEAEQGEAMQHSSGRIEAIGGKKHPQGGTPLQIQPSHEYIYSDSLGKDKNGNITLNEKDVVRSFADDAKAIQKKYSKREGDSIVDKTKELELGLLKQDAEQARIAKEEIEMGKQMKKYKAKYGANLKKFANSGYVPFTTFNQYGDEEVNPNSTLAMQQKLLQYNPNALPKYGADGLYGNETKQGFLNNPGVYDMVANEKKITDQTPIPSFGGGTGYQNSFIGPMMPSSRLPRGGFGPYPQGQIGDEKSRAVVQGRVAIDPVTKQRNGFFQDLTTGDKMQLASMLPAFGFNLGMGLKKYDVEPNRKNQYENDVINIMQNRKFDIQNYLNQANLATNTAKEDIGNNSTSVGGKIANIQKLYANSLNSLGDITTKGQEMNNQYRAEEANTKNIIGEANRAEANRASGITDQNKARKQQFLAKAFEQMGQGIAATGQSANQSLTNRLLAKSLSEIAPDFDIKELKDVYKDKDGYIVFRGEKYNYNPERNELMKIGNTITANAAKSQYAPKDFIMKTFANFTKAKTNNNGS